MTSGYFRFPTIHQDQIVFVSEDDLWTVPVKGGIARRLTANLGEVSHPRLSPDGKQIAFVGRDEGQAEIYSMPAEGGNARRLTFMGGTIVAPVGWQDNDTILFFNNAEHWYLRFTNLYTIRLDGGTPQKLEVGPTRAIGFGPGGGIVLGRNTDDPARWKRYRGGTAGQIWTDTSGEGRFTRIHQSLKANITSPMWLPESDGPGRVFFISDHEGVGNLYSSTPSGENLQRHTHHEDYYARNASTDGKRIVYHAGGELYVYDPVAGESELVPVEYHSPRVQRNRKFVSASRYLETWQLHPKGHSLAISSRGQVFTMANWEGAVFGPMLPASESTGTAIRMRLPRWLRDGKRVVAVGDHGGEESFTILSTQPGVEPVDFDGLDIGRPENVVVNPAKDQIAFSNNRYQVCILDLETGELQVIDKGRTGPIRGLSWSPDGEWLAYSASISLQRTAVKLWRADSGEITQIGEPVLADISPSFDPQGKYLYFLSYREFDPVYDSLQFDLGFTYGMRPYLVTLQKDLPSPFLPRLEEEGAGNEEKKDAETSEENDGETREEKTPQIRIDLEGISERIIAFPISDGRFGRIMGSKNGKPVYTRFPVDGELGETGSGGGPRANGALFYYNFEEQNEEYLTGGITDFLIGPDGETLVYRSKNQLRVLKAGEKPNNGNGDSPGKKSGWIDLNRIKVSIEPGAEWRQMFREAWRLQRDNFWTEDMSSVDWTAVHDRYLPLVDRIASRSEFSDLMWEMQGELGTSHAYEFGGDYRSGPHYGLGFLGARFKFSDESGAWEVTDFLQGDPWDEKTRSPLTAAGVNLTVGDQLLAVNGRLLSRDFSPSAALVNLSGQEITLTVRAADEGNTRTVTVKTLRSESPAMYRDWVNKNRAHVHEATGGRVGYIHIPDMGAAGYAEFHRGFLAELERDALIVDERFNRGGHVSGLLLQKLARRRVGFDVTRWGQTASPYPAETLDGPMVTLINEYAGSDGDIFAHAFKLLGLGPVIGVRTWGGVVGIWPRHPLVDGTVTTQPEFSFWFDDVGWGVENYGTDPNIEVDIAPHDYMAGEDPQLARGIAEVLKALESWKRSEPDLSVRPSLQLPKLPPAE